MKNEPQPPAPPPVTNIEALRSAKSAVSEHVKHSAETAARARDGVAAQTAAMPALPPGLQGLQGLQQLAQNPQIAALLGNLLNRGAGPLMKAPPDGSEPLGKAVDVLGQQLARASKDADMWRERFEAIQETQRIQHETSIARQLRDEARAEAEAFVQNERQQVEQVVLTHAVQEILRALQGTSPISSVGNAVRKLAQEAQYELTDNELQIFERKE